MEEDEENATAKKQRRKRKPRRGFTPEPDTPPVDSEEDYTGGEEKKRKRGRRKKKKDPTPPEEPEEEDNDVQKTFRVVQHLMAQPMAAAFMDKPDDTMNGMLDYYEIITKPMWLREVEHKYKGAEYKTATEMVADVRLMLENCYQYWGPCDVLSKRALKLEQLFENKLTSLPEELQKQCTLEMTHPDMLKGEPDDSLPKRVSQRKGGFVSKLLNWVVEGKDKRDSAQGTVNKIQAGRAERKDAEKELAIWEAEHLLTSAIRDQIASMWEFPVIGQFLHLVYNVLNIEPVSPLELERMLLMPQSSNTLATLITSMLIPPLFRAKLEVGPAMPYAIWTRRLRTKVTSWYRVYRSKGDSTLEVFDSLGIEPQFWLVMGEENLLEEYQFHELSFLQRVWLLKALCDFLLHNHKTIQECINNLDMDELREINLGRDKDGYSYHYFPMFTEVRIYKMARVPDAKWKNYDGGVEEAIASMCAEDDDDNEQETMLGLTKRPLHKPPRCMRPQSDFRLVCESLDDIRALIDKLKAADTPGSSKLMSGLKDVLATLEPREAKIDLAVYKVRCRMRDEWSKFQRRDSDYVDPGIAYWERKEKEEKKDVEETKDTKPPPDLSLPGTSSEGMSREETKGERRSRRESSLKFFSRGDRSGLDDESEEESPLDFADDSEDEWFASKKEKEIKKKRKSMSARKMKKISDLSDKISNSSLHKERDLEKLNINSPSSSGLQNGNRMKGSSINEPVKIKQEIPDVDDQNVSSKFIMNNLKHLQMANSKTPPKQKLEGNRNKIGTVTVKQEILEEPPSITSANANHNSVLQTLVAPVHASAVKEEKMKAVPITPDLTKVKRSNSPEDVVYISDSEEPADVKPNPAALVQRVSANPVANTGVGAGATTISYSIAQQGVGAFGVQNPPSQQFVPVNVGPGDQVFTGQPQLFSVAQPPTQPVAYQVQPTAIVRMPSAPRATLQTNPKFVVIQPNPNNVNQPNQFLNKSPQNQTNTFSTTQTMQNVNWFGPRGSPQSNVNYSPRQRTQPVVIRNSSPRARGSPQRSPLTPTRGGPRFSGRTPTSVMRTPTSAIRTPSQLGQRTPSPMRGRGSVTPVRNAGPVRNTGPVRSLSFNQSPVKPVGKPPGTTANPARRDSTPDIEGTLVVSMTESGGFGYVVMLPDGGKISLTQDQLAKIRSDNGGTLPKTCKVPLNMQTEGFRID